MCSGPWICIHEMVTALSLHQVCFTRIKGLLRVSPIPRDVWDKGCCQPLSCHHESLLCISAKWPSTDTRRHTEAHGSSTRHAPRVARPGPPLCSSDSASHAPRQLTAGALGGGGWGSPQGGLHHVH